MEKARIKRQQKHQKIQYSTFKLDKTEDSHSKC